MTIPRDYNTTSKKANTCRNWIVFDKNYNVIARNLTLQSAKIMLLSNYDYEMAQSKY